MSRRQTVRKGQPCLTATNNAKIRTMQHRLLMQCQKEKATDLMEVQWPNANFKMAPDGRALDGAEKTVKRKLPTFWPAYVNKKGDPKFALEVLSIITMKMGASNSKEKDAWTYTQKTLIGQTHWSPGAWIDGISGTNLFPKPVKAEYHFVRDADRRSISRKDGEYCNIQDQTRHYGAMIIDQWQRPFADGVPR